MVHVRCTPTRFLGRKSLWDRVPPFLRRSPLSRPETCVTEEPTVPGHRGVFRSGRRTHNRLYTRPQPLVRSSFKFSLNPVRRTFSSVKPIQHIPFTRKRPVSHPLPTKSVSLVECTPSGPTSRPWNEPTRVLLKTGIVPLPTSSKPVPGSPVVHLLPFRPLNVSSCHTPPTEPYTGTPRGPRTTPDPTPDVGVRPGNEGGVSGTSGTPSTSTN